uniref:Uncharacterized protein n=1 Tax=Strigamia maritima TaxID=126957 RepID=T1JHG4_STRMM
MAENVTLQIVDTPNLLYVPVLRLGPSVPAGLAFCPELRYFARNQNRAHNPYMELPTRKQRSSFAEFLSEVTSGNNGARQSQSSATAPKSGMEGQFLAVVNAISMRLRQSEGGRGAQMRDAELHDSEVDIAGRNGPSLRRGM